MTVLYEVHLLLPWSIPFSTANAREATAFELSHA